ncbi:glycosyltransferase [Aquihabitans sp. G128]|uniref:glycosyltransferase n=1 Tax=Aquihabitans sp. G128 TaxID=2849779 RepID=UPI001C220089|nr:glycosyltransferase [Aquihabitans sp. G128]QXC62827.1 glycosyltransferase [Aquihabitans sp. G128]
MVLAALRRAQVDGPTAVFDLALDRAFDRSIDFAPDADLRTDVPDHLGWPAVEVVADAVLVDLQGVAGRHRPLLAPFVVQACAERWARDHEPTFVRWGGRGTSLHRVDATERAAALSGGGWHGDDPPGDRTVLVPWRCTYLLLEPATERNRVQGLTGLLLHGGTTGAGLGFDFSPMTDHQPSAAPHDDAHFALSLAATRELARVVPVSASVAAEYEGWRHALAGSGATGPEVLPVPLAVDLPTVDDATGQALRDRLGVPGTPLVLVVGDHAPSSNHLGVLHAAELLWRRGLAFHLAIVGRGGADARAVGERAAALRRAGRLVELVDHVAPEDRRALYGLAHVVLHPSLGEAFATTVAEARSCGTPVVTSAFGAMAEAATGGGALLVDPRDARAVADAVERILVVPALHERLASAWADEPVRTWDAYAAEAWSALTGR